MREGVLDEPRHFPPWRFERGMGERGLFTSLGPGRGRSLEHATEQAFQRPLAQQYGAVIAQRHEGDPAPRWAMSLLLAIGQNLGETFCVTRAA
jgi:hypothetical protein